MASTVLTAQIIARDQTDVATKLTELLDSLPVGDGGLAHANLLDIEVIPFGQNQFVILVCYHA